MNKFEELKKKYDGACDTRDEIQKQYDIIRNKLANADITVKRAIIDTVTVIIEEVVGSEVDLCKGVAVKYHGAEGVLILDNVNVYRVDFVFYKLTKSGKVSARKETWFTFYFNRACGEVSFEDEFIGTPEQVVEFLKNNNIITFR